MRAGAVTATYTPANEQTWSWRSVVYQNGRAAYLVHYMEIARARSLSLPKSRFVRIDGVARQGSDTQQCLRTSRSDVCRACPSQARREFAPHYNRSQGPSCRTIGA